MRDVVEYSTDLFVFTPLASNHMTNSVDHMRVCLSVHWCVNRDNCHCNRRYWFRVCCEWTKK